MVVTSNDIEVKLHVIISAHVQAPVKGMVLTTLGPKFCKDTVKTAVIVRALYGLNLAGSALRSHLGICMESVGYMSCKINPDLWLKPEIRQEDGVYCYFHLLYYVDDILCIHHNSVAVLQWLPQSFPLKPGLEVQTCT